ncbi:hypothetical protein [Arthrobacter sp. ISL-28]|uniref:hypothetical protein n=1 Tax=Arthrobacter sp. ISL-28 TaxID=2819108 RepID=UPI001BE8F432|nr:hypothetical protein [Arthrobacter sp. ISL-28]MBT2522710.1 hypothetical protein [Arthrobacter sp. ISL-28]
MPAAEESQQRQVTATALGPWPGQDPVEAARIIRGELGSPHLPYLAELPDRGVGADAIGRTASLLVDMAVDVQTHGWRIVDRPGRDLIRARSALSTDINVLADVAGEEEDPAREFKVQLRGPLSLAAGLHLHNGERALIDYGARRDIAASLAAGVGDHLARVAGAVPGARLVVQLDEPDIASILAGSIPTSSGYRTLRSVPGQEVTELWRVVVDALRAAGAAEIAIAVTEIEAPFERILAAGADSIAVPLKALTSRQWEQLAEAVEAGTRLWAGAVAVDDAAAGLPKAAEVADALWRPWRQLGLPGTSLGAVRLTPTAGLDAYTPSGATAVLARLTQGADALNQLALG